MEINSVGQNSNVADAFISLRKTEEEQKNILELGQELNQAKSNEKLSAENETGIQPGTQTEADKKDEQSKQGNLVDTFA